MIYGIIGGMGSYATVHAFKRILDRFSSEDDRDYPRIIIDNNAQVPPRVAAALTGKNKEGVIDSINASVKNLRACGVDKAIIACNTAHVFFESLSKDVELVNMVKETIRQVPEEKKSLILATTGTLQAKIFPEKYLAPSEEEQTVVDKVIREIKAGDASKETIECMKDLLDEHHDKNIIVACTEISIFFNKQFPNINIYDTLEIGIETLLREH